MNQTGPENDSLFRRKRAALGACSLLCFLVAIVLYLIAPEDRGVVFAGAIRIGIVLAATWLALPQLRGMLSKLPALVPVCALLMVAICAPNPNLFRIIGTLIAVGVGLFALSNWIKTLSPK